jgi:hypothetical protein
MERLGRSRHRREGRKLSEREGSESNLLLFLTGHNGANFAPPEFLRTFLSRNIQRCLDFARHDNWLVVAYIY